MNKSTMKPLYLAIILLVTPLPTLADGSMSQDLLPAEKSTSAQQDLVIYPAKRVITMESNTKEVQAVAVRGKRIIGVGSTVELQQRYAAEKPHTDNTFQGKIIMPGFIDQHLHPLLGSLSLVSEVIATEDWVLPSKTFKAALTPDEYRSRLVAAEKALQKPDDVLFSWGYHKLWHGELNRKVLDGISATRPIIIWQRSCHEFILNTAALKMLNITPADFENRGTASTMANYEDGHFWEQGLLGTAVGPKIFRWVVTPERMEAGLRQMVAYEHANGVTAFNEPGALITPEILQLYNKILAAPDTPMYSTFIADGRGIVDKVGFEAALDTVEQTIAMAPEGPDKKVMFFPQQIKLFADGAIISQLMQMKEPYTDGHKGEWIINPDDMKRRAKLFWDAGYQIHMHVNGDLGADVVLETLEQLMKDNPRPDHRFVVVHFANSTENQVSRFANAGAIFSVNPYYTVGFADKYEQGLGKERADHMVRAASILKKTPHLSYHSDMPMAPSDPLYLAWAGINRITPSGRVAAPEQRISVNNALRAITIEAAYSWRKENYIGSIKSGKIANFTILDEDPYRVDPLKLNDIPVWGTVFEGKIFPVKANQSKPTTLSSVTNLKTENIITNSKHNAVSSVAITHQDGDDHCQMAEFSKMVTAAYTKNAKLNQIEAN